MAIYEISPSSFILAIGLVSGCVDLLLSDASNRTKRTRITPQPRPSPATPPATAPEPPRAAAAAAARPPSDAVAASSPSAATSASSPTLPPITGLTFRCPEDNLSAMQLFVVTSASVLLYPLSMAAAGGVGGVAGALLPELSGQGQGVGPCSILDVQGGADLNCAALTNKQVGKRAESREHQAALTTALVVVREACSVG